MRLKYQLFITLLFASAVLVAVMFAVSSFSFSRGFLGYINNADKQRIQPLVLELEQLYQGDGNWDNAAANPEILNTIVRSVSDRRRPRRRDDQSDSNSPPPPPPDKIHRRLILADADKDVLIGQSRISKTTDWHPISHNNEVVGYLGINKLKRLDNQIDRAFEKQQRRSFALAGLSMVLLSALLAALLASRFVKPILKVKKTVAEISDGNFTDRIEVTRRDEIGDLSRDINKLGTTLEKNKDARQRHFAEISHELRTPIGVLQAEIEALQDGIRPLDQSSINSLHAETLRLNRLIEDLHTLSLADAGALDYQMQLVNVAECVEAQIQRHRHTNPDLNIELVAPDAPLTINGDEQRLEQLLDNLMQNTVRYTKLPGRLLITLATDSTHITLSWEDSAPGVSAQALDKLFDPLFRAEVSRNREDGGSGLGLSIVAKIVDAHSGACEVQQSNLGGLKISIRFPKASLL